LYGHITIKQQAPRIWVAITGPGCLAKKTRGIPYNEKGSKVRVKLTKKKLKPSPGGEKPLLVGGVEGVDQTAQRNFSRFWGGYVTLGRGLRGGTCFKGTVEKVNIRSLKWPTLEPQWGDPSIGPKRRGEGTLYLGG